MRNVAIATLVLSALCGCASEEATGDGLYPLASSDVVLRVASAPTRVGWVTVDDATAAGGRLLHVPNAGVPKLSSAAASPAAYFEMSFQATAGTPYHLWLRMRAEDDYWGNDSVFVQLSDAVDSAGDPVARIGTTSALIGFLNDGVSNGGSPRGWGWNDDSYGPDFGDDVTFASSGTHTIRVQPREDGVMIDQIVLSPSTYLRDAPGPNVDDATILPASSGGGASVSLPGRLEAEDYLPGGEGVGYHDASGGNEGGLYRNDDVDIGAVGGGGYYVGWVEPGEWLAFDVDVASSGTYDVSARVATHYSGRSLHVEVDGVDVTGPMAVPNTGSWSTWANATRAGVSLSAGHHTLRIAADTDKISLDYVDVTPAAGSVSGGNTVRVMTWNISHGRATDGTYRPDWQARQIAAEGADVVCLNEAEAVADVQSELATRTGVPVHRSATALANAILSTRPITATSSLSFSANACGSYGAVMATIDLGSGGQMHVFCAHLAVRWGTCTTSASDVAAVRLSEMRELEAWATGFSGTRLIAGDMNAQHDTAEVRELSSSTGGGYVNAWLEAIRLGVASAYPDNPVGASTRTRKSDIDHIYYRIGTTPLSLIDASVPDYRDFSTDAADVVKVMAGCGSYPEDCYVRPSDHEPRIATFRR